MIEGVSGFIKRQLDSQLFAVLATQADGYPYTNLIAFAAADNLRSIIFVTNRNTRKYTNTMAKKQVAVLIDNRTNQASDLNSAVAVTALGAVEEAAGKDKAWLSEVFLARHPGLKTFLQNPDSALMRIAVSDYIIATFEDTHHYYV